MMGIETILRLIEIKHFTLIFLPGNLPQNSLAIEKELQAEISVLRLNADGGQLTVQSLKRFTGTFLRIQGTDLNSFRCEF